jgi:hypothetical protein
LQAQLFVTQTYAPYLLDYFFERQTVFIEILRVFLGMARACTAWLKP